MLLSRRRPLAQHQFLLNQACTPLLDDV